MPLIPKNPPSARRLIFRLVLLASLFALLCVAVAALLYESQTFRPRELRSLRNSTELLLAALPSALDFGDTENAEKYLRTFVEEASTRVRIAALYDAGGQLFARHSKENYKEAPPARPQPAGHSFGSNELSLWVPIERNGAPLGSLYILEQLPPLEARLPQYIIMEVAVVLALFIVGFFLVRSVRYYFVEPLTELLAMTGMVTAGKDYKIRASLHRSDELGGLAEAFNRMLEVIESRDEELRQVNARIKSVFDNTREVALIATDPEGRIQVFNIGAERMLGYEASEMIGRQTPMLWHKAEELRSRARLRKSGSDGFDSIIELARDGLHDAQEWTFVRKDGTEFPAFLALTAMKSSSGQITGYLGVATDLSQRRQVESERERLQSQLIQAQKMEAIGQLAGGVAHDFNNILAAMMLHIDLLRDNPDISAETKAELDELQSNANRAASLTRQLLVFSRRQVTQLRLVDLNSLVGNLLKMLHRLIGENISMEFHGFSHATWTNADSGMVEQVIMNLVVNARDAIQGNGRITLSVRPVVLTGTEPSTSPDIRPGRFVRLSVTDTGCGMDPTTLKHIFEPFFTTKEQGKGTGLGLATVYGIMKKHEGWVDVESTPGKGSCFSVYFPATREEELIDTKTEDHSRLPRGTETILLVEDDQAVRQQIQSVLQKSGYTVLVAVNGTEGMDLWKQRKAQVQLLLTDMIMPGEFSGLELAHLLRRDRPELRIIIMSGYSLELSQQEGFTDQHLSFFPKPFLAADLAGVVRRCLDADPRHSPATGTKT